MTPKPNKLDVVAAAMHVIADDVPTSQNLMLNVALPNLSVADSDDCSPVYDNQGKVYNREQSKKNISISKQNLHSFNRIIRSGSYIILKEILY